MSRLIKTYYADPAQKRAVVEYRQAVQARIKKHPEYLRHSLPVNRLIPTLPLTCPEYMLPLAEQVRAGLASKGEMLSSFGPDSFDAPGSGPDIVAQFGYDRLDRLDYIRENKLSAKAEAVLDSLTSAGASGSSSPDQPETTTDESSTPEQATE